MISIIISQRINFDGEKSFAIFEQGREEEDKISSVHYLQFHLTLEQITKLGDSNCLIKIVINYKDYIFSEVLSDSMKNSLYQDTQ